MKKIILIGAGGRGRTYSKYITAPEYGAQIVAVAEPIDTRRNHIRDTYSVPEEQCFRSWEPILSRPKFADLAIICTMDRDHLAPTLAAIEQGYDILLEKPMGATPEECVQITEAARKKGVFVLVCHVLRFTPFFNALKSVIDSGRIGRVIHVQHAEDVGNLHQSHSFVRGNWGNSDRSTPMIVQKTCHDMDILQWLIGERCSRVHSFGSLTYFREENAPEGAPLRCTDGCPHAETCHYYAPDLYLEHWRKSSFRDAATSSVQSSDEEVMEALRNGDYGKCVFRTDNNVVDHQTVNLEFEGGVTVSFSMCAFNRGGRRICIMGTEGELRGNAEDNFLTLYRFDTRTEEKIAFSDLTFDQSIAGGHGGGDGGIVRALCSRLDGNTQNVSICTLEETCRNHLIAYAAEESRVSGRVIDMKEYESRFGMAD